MPGSGEGAGDGRVADSLRPYAALVGVSKEKPVASGLGLGPKDRSLNPCHVQRSRVRGKDKAEGGASGPWPHPHHEDYLTLAACLSHQLLSEPG